MNTNTGFPSLYTDYSPPDIRTRDKKRGRKEDEQVEGNSTSIYFLVCMLHARIFLFPPKLRYQEISPACSKCHRPAAAICVPIALVHCSFSFLAPSFARVHFGTKGKRSTQYHVLLPFSLLLPG